jgi:hypothetical protein
LFGQCEQYRGALLNPNHLMNFTKKFESMMKKQNQDNKQILNMFTEK